MKLDTITLPQLANYYFDCEMQKKIFTAFEKGIDNKFEVDGNTLHVYLKTDDLKLFYSFRLLIEKGIHITAGNKYLYQYELGVEHLPRNKHFIFSFTNGETIIGIIQYVNYTEERDIHVEFEILAVV